MISEILFDQGVIVIIMYLPLLCINYVLSYKFTIYQIFIFLVTNFLNILKSHVLAHCLGPQSAVSGLCLYCWRPLLLAAAGRNPSLGLGRLSISSMGQVKGRLARKSLVWDVISRVLIWCLHSFLWIIWVTWSGSGLTPPGRFRSCIVVHLCHQNCNPGDLGWILLLRRF